MLTTQIAFLIDLNSFPQLDASSDSTEVVQLNEAKPTTSPRSNNRRYCTYPSSIPAVKSSPKINKKNISCEVKSDDSLSEFEEASINTNLALFKEIILQKLYASADEGGQFRVECVQWTYQFFDSSTEVNKFKQFNCKRFLNFDIKTVEDFESTLESQLKPFLLDKRKRVRHEEKESNHLSCLSNALKNIISDVSWENDEKTRNQLYIFHHLPADKDELEDFAEGHVPVEGTISPKVLRDALLPAGFRTAFLVKLTIRLQFHDIRNILSSISRQASERQTSAVPEDPSIKVPGTIRGLLRLLEAEHEIRHALPSSLSWYRMAKDNLRLRFYSIMKPEVNNRSSNDNKSNTLIETNGVDNGRKSVIGKLAETLKPNLHPKVESLLAEPPISLLGMKELSPCKKVNDWHQRCLETAQLEGSPIKECDISNIGEGTDADIEDGLSSNGAASPPGKKPFKNKRGDQVNQPTSSSQAMINLRRSARRKAQYLTRIPSTASSDFNMTLQKSAAVAARNASMTRQLSSSFTERTLSSNSIGNEKKLPRNASFISVHNPKKPIMVPKANGKETKPTHLPVKLPPYYETRSKTAQSHEDNPTKYDPYVYPNTRSSPSRVRRNLIFDINQSIVNANAAGVSSSSDTSPSVIRASPAQNEKKQSKSKRKLPMNDDLGEVIDAIQQPSGFATVLLKTPPNKRQKRFNEMTSSPSVIQASPEVSEKYLPRRATRKSGGSENIAGTISNSVSFYGSQNQSKAWEASSKELEEAKLKGSVENAQLVLSSLTSMQDFEVVPSSSPETESPEFRRKKVKESQESKYFNFKPPSPVVITSTPAIRSIPEVSLHSVIPSSSGASFTSPKKPSFDPSMSPLVLNRSPLKSPSPRRKDKTFQPSPLALFSSPADKSSATSPFVQISALKSVYPRGSNSNTKSMLSPSPKKLPTPVPKSRSPRRLTRSSSEKASSSNEQKTCETFDPSPKSSNGRVSSSSRKTHQSIFDMTDDSASDTET